MLYFFIGSLKHEVLKMHAIIFYYFNCLNQNWASSIAFSWGFFWGGGCH